MRITRQNYESYFLDYIEGNLDAQVVAELMVFLEANPDLAQELELLDATPVDTPHVEFEYKATLKKEEIPVSYQQLNDLLVKDLEGDISIEESILLESLCSQFPSVANARTVFAKTKLIPENIFFAEKSELIFPDVVDYSDMRNLMIGKMEGDLDPEQEKVLKNVIAKNPTLQSELDQYRRTKLRADNIVFDAKSSLKKKETRVITFNRTVVYVAAAASVALLLWVGMPGGDTVNGKLASETTLNPVVKGESNNSTPGNSSVSNTAVQGDTKSIFNVPSNELPGEVDESYAEVNQSTPVRNQQSYSKLDHLNAGSFATKSESGEIVVKSENVMLPGEDMASAHSTPAAGQVAEYPTLLGLFEEKAKTRLWGNENYPDEKFAAALAEKAMHKQSTKENSLVAFERVEESDGRLTKVKIGFLEYEKKSRK